MLSIRDYINKTPTNWYCLCTTIQSKAGLLGGTETAVLSSYVWFGRNLNMCGNVCAVNKHNISKIYAWYVLYEYGILTPYIGLD